MTIFKRWTGNSLNMPPLHWSPELDEGSKYLNRKTLPGQVVALVSCVAGHHCALRVPVPHTISAEGVMMPSLACPTPGCSGHEAPGSVLEGWGKP